MSAPPEFPHGALSRAELHQAIRQCAALAVHSRGRLAASWRELATALAEQHDPRHQTSPDDACGAG